MYALGMSGWMEGVLACPKCRRLYYARPAADVRRELIPGETFEEWLRCSKCGTPSTQFRAARAGDVRSGVVRILIYECVVQR
jgi:hypothetical protein